MDSVKATDEASKAVQKTPNRVSLDQILASITSEELIYPPSIPHMTIMVMTVENGYAVIGKSAPADPDNFNKEIGIKFAREDCIRQLWPLFAFSLRDKLSA